MIEEWKILPGYYKTKIYDYQKDKEPIIEVSNLGKIRSLRYKEPKLMYIGTNSSGYKYFQFRHNGKRKSLLVHRAVLLTFIGENLDKVTVNHKDHNKSNNKLDNLEWCTQQENIKYDWSTGYRKAKKGEDHHFYNKVGYNHPKSKEILQLSLEDNSIIKKWGSIAQAAQFIGVSRSYLAGIVKGNKKTKGYRWSLA